MNSCIKFFTTPNSKNIIATLRTVAVEKFELTFLIILYFHGRSGIKSFVYIWQRKSNSVNVFAAVTILN